MTLFMNNLRRQVYFDKSDFMFYSCDEGAAHYEMQNFSPVRWTESEINRYIQTYMHMDDVLPILFQRQPITFRNNDLFSLQERKKTRYYREFVEEAQLEISIDANIPLPKDANMKAIIGIFRNSDRKEFSQKDLEIVKLYQVHLSKTLKQHLTGHKLTGDTLLYSFNQFESFGICILQENRGLLSFNTTYRKYATEGGESLSGSPLTRKLQELAAKLTDTRTSIGPVAFEIREQRYLLELTKFGNKKRYLSIIHSLSDYFMKQLTSLKDTCGVSNREFEILFLLLKRGLTIEEIFTRLYISPATVKRHISSACQKIGIRSQKQLLNILQLL